MYYILLIVDYCLVEIKSVERNKYLTLIIH